MIRLISAVVAFALMASPALAASKQYRSNASRAQAPYEASSASPMYAPFFASAGIPLETGYGPGAVVFKDGRYVGQDPDPNVRLNLLRDAGQ